MDVPQHLAADHPVRVERAKEAFARDLKARANAAKVHPSELESVLDVQIQGKPLLITYDILGEGRLWEAVEMESPSGARQIRIVFNVGHRFAQVMLDAPPEQRAGFEIVLATIAMTGVDLDDPKAWQWDVGRMAERIEHGMRILDEILNVD